MQVVVNYASSAGAAEEVAEQIKQSGGDATVVQADLSKPEDIQKYPPTPPRVSLAYCRIGGTSNVQRLCTFPSPTSLVLVNLRNTLSWMAERRTKYLPENALTNIDDRAESCHQE